MLTAQVQDQGQYLFNMTVLSNERGTCTWSRRDLLFLFAETSLKSSSFNLYPNDLSVYVVESEWPTLREREIQDR